MCEFNNNAKAEQIAGEFHRFIGWVSAGVAAGCFVMFVATVAQARWHFQGARTHLKRVPALRKQERVN